ncbi:MAG TPA: LOG family protein [bacterium]|nr:LOG family protein [bacterium]
MRYPRVRSYKTGRPSIDAAIHRLIQKAGSPAEAEFLEEIIVTALKVGEDEMERGDVKMINTTLKELRYALKVFYPFRHVRKVAIFGSARTPKNSPDYRIARDFAREIVRAGWMVITGASSGIMSAGNEGAGRANSFGVNIRLPFEQEANPVIANDPKLINFKYFFTRKLIFIRESDATVLCPGGFGTQDEGFETLTLVQTGKAAPRPIVCLDPPDSHYWQVWREFMEEQFVKRAMVDEEDLDLIHFTHDPKDAVRVITEFYRNFHSLRYIRDLLVMRIKKPLTDKQLLELNRRFKGILKKGKIEQQLHHFEEEENEPHTLDLARIILYFNRRHFANLKRLIDAINKC